MNNKKQNYFEVASEFQVKSKYIIPVSDTGLTHSSNFVYRILNLPFTEFHDVWNFLETALRTSKLAVGCPSPP